eukprot:4350664-Amphidinium_carterae.1
MGGRIAENHAILSWLPMAAADAVSHFRLGSDGRTAEQRRSGRTGWLLPPHRQRWLRQLLRRQLVLRPRPQDRVVGEPHPDEPMEEASGSGQKRQLEVVQAQEQQAKRQGEKRRVDSPASPKAKAKIGISTSSSSSVLAPAPAVVSASSPSGGDVVLAAESPAAGGEGSMDVEGLVDPTIPSSLGSLGE